jgi:hydrophobe/amphiphile efflux-1 (HAE1) family protein
MNIPEHFIRRPVMTTLVTAGISIFGWMAYLTLPVSDLPNVDYPILQITANLPGANPETMASAVATPLEQGLATIPGIESMTSTSSTGNTSITVQFTLDRNLDAAAQDVQSAISSVLRRLPQDMPSPPSFRKQNPSDDPVLLLGLSSSTLPLSEVNEYAEEMIAQRISTIEGVAAVNVMGAQKYAVRVQVDPRALAARGIGLDEVRTALNTNNVQLPAGTIQGDQKAMTLRATGQLRSAEGFKKVIVTYRNGAAVRLADVADVIDSVEANRAAGWYNQERAIILYIRRQPGSNTIKVVDSIKELLPGFRAQMPGTVNLEILADRTISIRESVEDVKFTLVLAICLVVLVIFLFLRSLPATVIPSIAMPIAIIGTFGVMHFFDYSIDNLSLLALTLSVGFIVDDAIVMLENIVRHIENGEPVMSAALKGAKEISFTLISMTISLVAVFIPVLFMSGILGRLLREFAVTISAAVLVSGFISLTLTPMLASRFLKPIPHGAKHGWFYEFVEGLFQGSLNLYRRTLRLAIQYRALMLVLAAAMIGLTAWLVVIIPKGFVPTEDTGRLNISLEAAEDISFDGMVKLTRAASAIVGANPYVDRFSASLGQGPGAQVANQGRMNVTLKDRKSRPAADIIAAQLRADLSHIPGLRAFPQVPPSIRVGGRTTSSVYQYTLYGTDIQELYSVIPGFMEKVREIPGLIDVNTDLLITSPQLIVDIERDKASSLGLSAQQIEDVLYSAFGSRQVSTIYTPSNQYFVILEIAEKYQKDPSALSLLYLRNKEGKLIPLEAVTKIRQTVGPLTVTHMGQVPSVTVTFNLAQGISLSEVTGRIEELGRTELPATINATFQGTAAAFTSSLQGLGIMLLVAILVIYLVLGMLYENFIHPITILSGLPAATFGALLTLIVFRQELNIYGYVGLIMLIGIVKKNAIMMIDFALEATRSRGQTAENAIFEACIVRFRPIMMTTFAALAGTLPIALGHGAGAETRRSLGLAVIGGLIISQLLTLYITPAFYIYLDKFTKYLSPKPAHEIEAETATAAGMAK